MSTEHYFEEIGAWPRGTSAFARNYIVGFFLSILLTLLAYYIARAHGAGTDVIIGALLLLALLQLLVQLVFFLHLSYERFSRARLIAFGAAAIVVCILVVGSLWIMTHLNERMMGDPDQMNAYMQSQAGM